MTTGVEQLDEQMRRKAEGVGTTTVRRGELLRHPVYTRVLHWLVAITFVLALLSGFALYSPWLFRFLTPIFGGGAMTRLLHPWLGLAFDIFFLFQCLNWLTPMLWTRVDTLWLKRIKRYATNEDKVEQRDVGFFNGGQKVYFWAIVVSAVLFLVTGVLLWFNDVVPRGLVTVSYVVHDLAALLMLAGFLIHIYEGTAAMPGTFRSMINGTVTDKWAWTHHPAWYRDVTGRDPGKDLERAQRDQSYVKQDVEQHDREQRHQPESE